MTSGSPSSEAPQCSQGFAWSNPHNSLSGSFLSSWGNVPTSWWVCRRVPPQMEIKSAALLMTSWRSGNSPRQASSSLRPPFSEDKGWHSWRRRPNVDNWHSTGIRQLSSNLTGICQHQSRYATQENPLHIVYKLQKNFHENLRDGGSNRWGALALPEHRQPTTFLIEWTSHKPLNLALQFWYIFMEIIPYEFDQHDALVRCYTGVCGGGDCGLWLYDCNDNLHQSRATHSLPPSCHKY